ncbi:MAG TPA: ABC transporter ATP-binding protein, partial [Bacillota bacterium]|nr:ABC transporter ATP-binding protein [Bacillota bacterium]
MLTLTAIDKSFDQRKVLEKFQLKVAATEMVGIMGPSGCGKSTLLRLIAGLEKPDGGEIRWHGKIISNPQNIQPPHERQMGMIFQNLALWPHLTVEQHFAYGMAGVTSNERQRRIVKVAEYLQITQLLKQFPSRLSGGEKQRVALGRALLANPQILLCDEPFS